jgi:hypothetical protein
VYRNILYVLDRGHGLQAPCGESGSNCGFAAASAGLQLNDSRSRSRGNVGIPAGISKGVGRVESRLLLESHGNVALGQAEESLAQNATVGEQVRELSVGEKAHFVDYSMDNAWI